MSKINVLDNATINKIAAGEVIERPFSVVKELVENSIDADSTKISVEIKDGGISLIKIMDDGLGIPGNEVKTAFLRHATSKLKTVSDFNKIATLGFRGEALASIAAVSQVQIITRTSLEQSGTKVEVSGGKIVSEQKVSSLKGTTVTMKNLFFNMPARKKFLKSPVAESGMVSEYINRLALSRPDIAFKFINNNTTVMQTNGSGDLSETIFSVYGKNVYNSMEKISYSKDGIRITGFVGHPAVSRGNRTFENIFINGRYVKDKLVQSASEAAMKTLLTVGKFPLYVINIEVNPSSIDVNAHPQKLEVRFLNENKIYESVYSAISDAFKDSVLTPKFYQSDNKINENVNINVNNNITSDSETEKGVFGYNKNSEISQTTFFNTKDNTKNNFHYENKQPSINNSTDQNNITNTLNSRQDSLSFSMHTNEYPLNDASSILIFRENDKNYSGKNASNNTVKSESKNKFFSNYKIVGQVFGTYWIVENESSIYLIDQHAAHERVMFEKLINCVNNNENYSQMLLTPLRIKLSINEAVFLNNYFDYFVKMGFKIIKNENENENNNDVDNYFITAIPSIFGIPSNSSFFMDIIDMGIEESMNAVLHVGNQDSFNKIAQTACKAAIKAKDNIDIKEAHSLIRDLLLLDNPFTCPHGRPTITEFTKHDIEKAFKRV